MISRQLQSEWSRCLAIAVVIAIGAFTFILFIAVFWRNLVNPLGSFQTTQGMIVGETFISDFQDSNGVAPGVVFDLSERSSTAQWLGALNQRRAVVSYSHTYTEEVVTHISKTAAKNLKLDRGAVPEEVDNWLIAAGVDGLTIGNVVEISGKAYIVYGICNHIFSFPRLTPSKYIIGYKPNQNSRGGGSGYLIAKARPSVSQESLMNELRGLMQRIRTERIEDSRTELKLYTPFEFSVNASFSAISLAFLFATIIGLALTVQAALVVILGLVSNYASCRIKLMLGASPSQAVSSLRSIYLLSAAFGTFTAWLGSTAALHWLSAQSTWAMEWPSRNQILVTAIICGVLLTSCVAFLIWASAHLLLSWKKNENSRHVFKIVSNSVIFLFVMGATWILLASVPITRKIDSFVNAPKGIAFDNLYFATGVEYLDKQRSRLAWERFKDNLSQQPAVECVALADQPPLTTVLFPYDLKRKDGISQSVSTVLGRHVSSNYRKCLGISLLDGNDLPDKIASEPAKVPVLIGLSVARRLFPGKRAIGEFIECQYGNRALLEVVGVVSDSRQLGLRGKNTGEIFLPLQFALPGVLVMKTREFLSNENALRMTSDAAGADIRVQISTIHSLTEKELSNERFYQKFFSILAISLMTLAAIGLGSAVYWLVVKNLRWLAIRVALGTTAESALFVVVNDFLPFIFAGALAGCLVLIQNAHLLQEYVPDLDFSLGMDYCFLFLIFILSLALSLLPAWVRLRRTDFSMLLRAPET
jgi:hypothetical protein